MYFTYDKLNESPYLHTLKFIAFYVISTCIFMYVYLFHEKQFFEINVFILAFKNILLLAELYDNQKLSE